MIDIVLLLILFVVSLFVLIKASHFFTTGAERIGLHFGLSPFIVGVTILAIGTSLPELISSIIAVMAGYSEMVIGNVVGSNIANIFLVFAIATIISKKMIIGHKILDVDLPKLLGSAFLLTLMVWDGVFNFYEAILCILALLVYVLYAISSNKSIPKADVTPEMKADLKHKAKYKKESMLKPFITLIVSGFFIFLGAKYTVSSVIGLSQVLQIGTEIIAVTAIALGTSLPELIVTITAARKGHAEMAAGNVLGSNIFNTFAVMGIPALFGNLVIPSSILLLGIPMMLAATLIFFAITQDNQANHWEGWLMLIFYVFFIGKTVGVI